MATEDTPLVPAPAAAAADPVVETTNTESNDAADNGNRSDNRGQKRGGRGRDNNRNPNRDRGNPNNIKTGGFGSNKYGTTTHKLSFAITLPPNLRSLPQAPNADAD